MNTAIVIKEMSGKGGSLLVITRYINKAVLHPGGNYVDFINKVLTDRLNIRSTRSLD